MNGIKSKAVNPQQVEALINRINYKALITLITIGIVSSCTKNKEKEVWIVPCNYTGTLTVYFNAKRPDQSLEKNRIYKFNEQGVYYSNLNTNDGFTPDFNKMMSIEMNCTNSKKSILYYDNADSSQVKPGEFYATYFLSGNDSLYCESILVLRKK